jgi:hypothetical protein
MRATQGFSTGNRRGPPAFAPVMLDDRLICYGSVMATTRLFSVSIFPRLTINLFVWLRVGSAISNVTTLPHRSLAVVPLARGQRYYGEVPAMLR